ncbi:lysophospholipid acyltransferase family protein [Actinoplanes sp. NBRC 103695]|uniref:lysophospholipid acyltransferase family protein n=1 Tax=Actinoplanes sp. NBRC 103695 TaxID=3032202 RepID=UPI0024A35DCE|nr:lysophospholipid acyltransferase family protein [Actinoplanes sp. NBRC 103695]GLY93385.1 1-acyl-sn-glycerol-3-phosphate acyltransferase [Actinoplanes sp. NBRC 103695]
MFYWLLKYVLLGPLLLLLFRPRVDGLANVPGSGPVILACNHLSFSDSIFTPLIVRRRVTFVAKAEYFTGKGIKGWLMRHFFTGTGTIPVDRSGGKAAQAALDTLLRVLRQGDVAGIYPEGTRSPDGRLYRGKTGVARLALESGALVVPVAHLNSDEIQPTGKLIPKIKPVRMRFGAPLDFSRYADRRGDRFVERAVTDEIMYEIMTLSGRPYVDVYASTLKTTVEAPAPQGSGAASPSARDAAQPATNAAPPSPRDAAGPKRP